jgi:hypothetical protein
MSVSSSIALGYIFLSWYHVVARVMCLAGAINIRRVSHFVSPANHPKRHLPPFSLFMAPS